MSDDDDNDSARDGKSDRPLMERGQLYTRSAVLRRLPISKQTFERWVRDGLRPRLYGTKEQLFLSDDIFDHREPDSGDDAA